MIFDHGLIEKDESGKANKYRASETGNPITQSRRPGSRTITRSF
jgi:hypothetical protein